MNDEKRRNWGVLGSVGLHLLLVLLIAFTGVLHTSHASNEEIVEVAIYGGGGGGGGGGAGGGDDAGGEIEAEPKVAEADAPAPAVQDGIFEQGKNATPVAKATPRPTRKKSGSGSGGGKGTGHGTGTGSGYGPGSGSGSGGGSGSGYGTGTGSGIGPGSGIYSQPAIPPRVVRSPYPSYPTAEKNAGIGGVVVLRLLIGKDGSVESVSVSKSSGNANLDAAASAACSRWRFTSAKNQQGQKVRCYASIPVTFKPKN